MTKAQALARLSRISAQRDEMEGRFRAALVEAQNSGATIREIAHAAGYQGTATVHGMLDRARRGIPFDARRKKGRLFARGKKPKTPKRRRNRNV